MQNLDAIQDYLRLNATELGERILSSYPALHSPQDKPSPLLSQLLRRPYPAQALAMMGVMRRWHLAHNANVVAECGAGKTLIALGSMFVHSAGRPFSALVMAPPHLVLKWGRETIQTLPNVRVFLIEDMRNGGNPREPHGIHEARLRRGEIVREGMHTTLAELRRLGRDGWRKLCPESAIFCIGREKAKLSYFWKHCYGKSRSGKFLGALTNPDTGCPIETDGVRLSVPDFEKKRLHEVVEGAKEGTTRYSALWQADRNKIVRMAPAEYMGRYMHEWFDYAVADELHQLAGDTAQGNALGVLARTSKHFLGLTGTLLSGYADDLFNTLFRTDARRMVEEGYEWGSAGRERFTRDYRGDRDHRTHHGRGQCLLEENQKDRHHQAQARRLPTAVRQVPDGHLRVHRSGRHLRRFACLPGGRHSGQAGGAAQERLRELEREITDCLHEHRGNSSVLSTMLNALLCWPDHPYGFGTLYGSEFNPETKCREKFVIAETVDLDCDETYAKGTGADRRGRRRSWRVAASVRSMRSTPPNTTSSRGWSRGCAWKASAPPCSGPASLRIKGKPGIRSNCVAASTLRSATPSWSRPDWICWISRPSCFMRPAIRCTPCVRRAAVRGASDSGVRWR